jgi:hypothetical protein
MESASSLLVLSTLLLDQERNSLPIDLHVAPARAREVKEMLDSLELGKSVASLQRL